MKSDRIVLKTHGFSVVLCRNPEGKWLAVKETKGRGWWLPAGSVNEDESYEEAAHRQTIEEGGIEMNIKGILRIEQTILSNNQARMRVIFFSIPKAGDQSPKRISNMHSEEARWVSLKELEVLSKIPPGLRGPELWEWGNYIENGGLIAPLSFLSREDSDLPDPMQTVTQTIHIEEPLGGGTGDPTINDMRGAVEREDDTSLRHCLNAGLDPNVIINSKNWTSLHFAIKLQHENCVRLLLIVGADPSLFTHKKRNSLHFAVQGSLNILRDILLTLSLLPLPQKKAIINFQDIDGNTPLHFGAGSFGNSARVELLKNNGGDMSLVNAQGQTPLFFTTQSVVFTPNKQFEL